MRERWLLGGALVVVIFVLSCVVLALRSSLGTALVRIRPGQAPPLATWRVDTTDREAASDERPHGDWDRMECRIRTRGFVTVAKHPFHYDLRIYRETVGNCTMNGSPQSFHSSKTITLQVRADKGRTAQGGRGGLLHFSL